MMDAVHLDHEHGSIGQVHRKVNPTEARQSANGYLLTNIREPSAFDQADDV